MTDRTKAHILMIILVITWGFDYVPAKWALYIMSPMALLLLKYCIGLIVGLILKLVTKNRNLIRLKDLPLFVLCSIFGEVLYFYCEYSAMNYLPVGLLTIILGFVPMVSILIERIVYHRLPNRVILIGIAFCIIGIILVIGGDLRILLEGRIWGYVLAFLAVFSWNAYNFITASLQQYDSLTLSCTQMVCTILLCAPLAIHSGLPALSEYTPAILGGLLWMGLFDAGLGFLIMVYGLQKLGPTTSAIYSDFLPVSTAFFGAVFLHESISWLQIIGGIIVIASGYVVIREKGRLDEERLALTPKE
ncbi:MAG: DMT family transporter [Firmicutes bacterium]|nr:DMT family transporter [Bacillota bacterium]